jgi:cytochrome-b5 reductase
LTTSHLPHHACPVNLENSRPAPSGTCTNIAPEPWLTSLQSFRTYATEAPAKGGSATPWIVGGAAAAAGYGGYRFLGTKANADAPAPAAETKKADPKPTFTGGDQGFIDLKLKEVLPYNHNTKKFVFELPEADQVSGLHVACTFLAGQIHHMLTA